MRKRTKYLSAGELKTRLNIALLKKRKPLMLNNEKSKREASSSSGATLGSGDDTVDTYNTEYETHSNRKSEEFCQAHLNNLIQHHQLRMSQEEINEKLKEAKKEGKIQGSLININNGYQTDYVLGRYMYLEFLKSMITAENNSKEEIVNYWKKFRMYFK